MNHQLLVSITCASLMLVSLGGCRSDEPLLTDLNVNAGKGRVALNLDLDTSPMRGPRAAAARDVTETSTTDVTTNDLTISLTHNLYDIEPTVFNPGEYTDTTQYVTGPYTVEAMYGDPEAEGWDMPRYYGSQDIVIENQSTTTVDLPVTMDNARITLDFSDAFNNYLSECVVSVATASGETFDWSESEGRDLYVNPGEISLTVEFTKPSGLTGEFTTALETEARHAYTIVIDADFQSESLELTFDDTFEEKKVDVDISDANLPNLESAPIVMCDGFTPGQMFTTIESFRPEAPLKATISARSGIKGVKLLTTSASLQAKHWPAEIDLVNPLIAEGIMKQLELKTFGLGDDRDIFAVVDFTDLISHITYVDEGDNTTTFTLIVTDNRDRQLEQQLFSFTFEKLTLEVLPDPSSSYVTGEGSATVQVHYNGPDVKSLRLQAKDEFGIYKDITSLPTASGNNIFTFNVQGCDLINYDRTPVVRAAVGDNYTSADVSFKIPTVRVIDALNNEFATHAYVTVRFTDDAASTRKSDVSFEVSDGSGFSSVASELVEANRSRAVGDQAVYHITGLAANRTYSIRARLGEDVSVAGTLTTEEAGQIPNSDMESWDKTATGKNWERWNVEGWATYNPMTTGNTGTRNETAYVNRSGTAQSTDKASGSYAAELRTIGWGSGNSAVGSISDSNPKYITKGMLYLGGSPTQYDHLESQATKGVEFSCRPTSVSFQYKYKCKNSADYGGAKAWVKDAEGNIIASGSVSNLNSSSYTTATISLSNYAYNAPKAAQIYIEFSSSDHPQWNTRSKDWFTVPSFGNLSNGVFQGSSMFIDDIKLNY